MTEEFDRKILAEILVKDYGILSFNKNNYHKINYYTESGRVINSDNIAFYETILVYSAGHIVEQIPIKRYKSYIREKNIKKLLE